MTRQLLAFSRRQVVATESVRLKDIVFGMVPMLQRLLGEDVRLDTRLAAEVGCVEVDRGQMEQVVLNLVVNARDAMPGGGRVTVEVKAAHLDETYASAHAGARAGPHIVLVVTDTGVGMDEATKAHLFEPFFTTKGPDQGTGLGLSTVYGIVTQAHGHVSVASEVGRGSAFQVYLPKSTRVGAAPAPALAAIAQLQGSGTILVVEDDPLVRDLARTVLETHGYTVLAAGHAGEALLRSERHAGTIDVLLTDVVMPDMGGPELATRILALRPGIRVVFMSGHAGSTETAQALLERAHAFVEKPFTSRILAAAIQAVLSEAAAVAEPAGRLAVS